MKSRNIHSAKREKREGNNLKCMRSAEFNMKFGCAGVLCGTQVSHWKVGVGYTVQTRNATRPSFCLRFKPKT